MSLLARLFASPRPMVAVEISARHVGAVRLETGTPPVVAAHAVEPLAPGAVAPGLAASNISDGAAVAAAVRRVLDRVGHARHVALVVPDAVARVALVRFDQVPARTSDLEAMLRWNVRKGLPFKIDDAQVTWAPGAAVEGGREFVVVAARRDLIGEYEAACVSAGAHPGLVDIATSNLINLHLAAEGDTGDALIVHVTAEYATLAVVRDGTLIFFRHRGADGTETLADLVHQTAMYYEDRLGGRGFGRVLIAGASQGPDGAAGADALRRSVEDRLRIRVEALDLRKAASLEGRGAADLDVLDQLGPMVGILLREPAA
jgi:Tfp pilus assembly PilM family ATPase